VPNPKALSLRAQKTMAEAMVENPNINIPYARIFSPNSFSNFLNLGAITNWQ
jgi:hypothetical protein